MVNVYREILPDSYLLILTDAQQVREPGALRRALQRASTSGKATVWVDCSQLHHPSPSAIQLLADFYVQLHDQHIPLILCHLEEEARQAVQKLPPASQPLVLETLLDASLYCRNLHNTRLRPVA